MNRRPFVVLPFPQRGQEFVSIRETTRPTNGQIVRAEARPMVRRARRESTVRFFQDIHGFVHNGKPDAPQLVACAHGRGVGADQMVR
jgi:hypothetical protein